MLVGAYFKHLLASVGPHGVHSPFVFNLITEILVRKQQRAVWSSIEEIRRTYLNDHTTYEAADFGAGSKNLTKSRSVSDSVSSAAMPKWKGEILHLLIEHLNPDSVIELGTHFGMGSLYLSTGLGDHGKLITIEADPSHVAYSLKTFQKFEKCNVTVIEGTFDHELDNAFKLTHGNTVVFIDGNHTEEATLHYFNLVMNQSGVTAIIFDDIYWSQGMKRAWRTICEDLRVQLSLDFYWFGVIFLNGRMQKEHFTLRWPR